MARHFNPLDAGPSGPEPPEMSEMVEAVAAELEDGGAPQSLIDQVVRLIEAWEHTLAEPEPTIDVPEDERF